MAVVGENMQKGLAPNKLQQNKLLVVLFPIVDNFHQFAFENNGVCAVTLPADKAKRWVNNAPPIVALART